MVIKDNLFKWSLLEDGRDGERTIVTAMIEAEYVFSLLFLLSC
jgi:hypothetical protein